MNLDIKFDSNLGVSYFDFENSRSFQGSDVVPFYEYVERRFSDYLQHKKKKRCYVAGFSFVLAHACWLVWQDLVKDAENSVFRFDLNDFDRMRKVGAVFRVCKDNSKRAQYSFNDINFSHSTLIKCINEIESIGWFEYDKGFNFPESGKYRIGAECIDYVRFYQEFYSHVSQIFQEFVRKKKGEAVKIDSVVVKKREVLIDSEGVEREDYKVLSLRNESLRGKSIIRRSKAFIRQLDSFYEGMDVRLRSFNEVEEDVRIRIKEEWEKKRGRQFNKQELLRDIERAKTYVELYESRPRRIFHLNADENLQWGRIYGNKGGVDILYSYLTPLLEINGQDVIEIDIKSCILQLFVLSYCEGVDNIQDFYDYRSLVDSGLNREDVKLLTQCLLNNSNNSSARKAFCYKSKSMTQERFDDLVSQMINERKYFKGLFYKPTRAKEMIRVESDFMIEVMKKLMTCGNPLIYHFDSLFVLKSDLEVTLKTMQSIAKDKWNKSLNVSFDV